MNDARRLDVERYFDGELPAGQDAEVARQLAEDPEAQRYRNQLSLLRDLARRHNPAAGRTAVRVSVPGVPRARSVRTRAVVAAAVAAGVVAAIIGRHRPNQETPVAAPAKTVVPLARVAPTFLRSSRSPELAAYVWANAPSKRSGAAVLALLVPKTRGGRRPASVEILALELANARPQAAEKLERIVVLHRPAPGGGGRSRHERHERRNRPTPPRA